MAGRHWSPRRLVHGEVKSAGEGACAAGAHQRGSLCLEGEEAQRQDGGRKEQRQGQGLGPGRRVLPESGDLRVQKWMWQAWAESQAPPGQAWSCNVGLIVGLTLQSAVVVSRDRGQEGAWLALGSQEVPTYRCRCCCDDGSCPGSLSAPPRLGLCHHCTCVLSSDAQ